MSILHYDCNYPIAGLREFPTPHDVELRLSYNTWQRICRENNLSPEIIFYHLGSGEELIEVLYCVRLYLR